MFSNKDFHKEYLKYIERLESLDFNKYYWHGTGRFQYYEKGEVKDVLEQIIKNNGLLPLVKDPWLKSDGEYKYTISLAKNRMYASIYAFVHQDKNKNLQYRNKSRQFWAWLIGLNNLLHKPLSIARYALTFLFAKGSEDTLIQFQTKFNSNIKKKKTFWGQLFAIPSMRSNIKNNYAILFAIEKDSVKTTSLNSGFEYYEARTEENIKLDKLAFIEVPLKNVQETQNLLQKENLKIPIFPLEFVEYYLMNNYKIKDLLKPI